ncbi:MAG: succinate dehydrogenase assembly factor 2 [Alphaproteobacteria bacterium]|nr:succinate dehydrogenase assembly factor 2 [Alphaproteobacteria bacterium]
MPQMACEVETLENKRKRLGFRAWHRGTREMDLLMGSFADRNLANFGEKELAEFEEILCCNDPDVYDWVSGQKSAPEAYASSVLDLLLQHRFAK